MSVELALLGQILRLAGNPGCQLEDFGEKVATSPQLAAKVVRVSNSALYGMEGKINRLERAVLILGMRTVADIASAVLVSDAMKGLRIGALSGDALWRHSLETGVCAQLIARCLSLPLESEAYLAGLLHDLGILDLHQAHGEPYAELVSRCWQEGMPLAGAEAEAFGESHSRRLLSAAEDWGFPDVLRESIGFHDSPEEAPEASRTLASLVRAAHVVVPEQADGWNDIPSAEEDERVLADLGLEPDDVIDIQSLLEERVKELTPLFA